MSCGKTDQQTNKQTNKHINFAENPTHATVVGVGNYGEGKWEKFSNQWFQLT